MRQKRGPSSPWNDLTEHTLKTMAHEGYSTSQIAKAIGGITRNAIIGKAGRMGVKLRHGKASVHKGQPAFWKRQSLLDAPWAGPKPVIHRNMAVLPFRNDDRSIRKWLAEIDRRDSARRQARG